jgi:hypothetical protein
MTSNKAMTGGKRGGKLLSDFILKLKNAKGIFQGTIIRNCW